MRAWLAAVVLVVVGLAGCAGEVSDSPSPSGVGAGGESARQVSPEEVARLRAIDACEKEAALQGFHDGGRRRRFVERCVARRGYTLPSVPESLQERETEDLEWLQRFRQSP